ncbi:MAG TPA: hypothetical protein VGK24_00285 [Candidatus Angelobacter sp.]|jgi:hypothetical protein
MPSVRQSVKRLTHRFLLLEQPTISVRELLGQFKPTPPNSVHALLLLMNSEADAALPTGGGTRPYYRRRMPIPQDPNLYGIWGIDMLSVKLAVKRLIPLVLSSQPTISVKSLLGDPHFNPPNFQPTNSLRVLLREMNATADRNVAPFVDLTNVPRPLDPNKNWASQSFSVKQWVKRLTPRLISPQPTIGIRSLIQRFKPSPPTSLRALLQLLNKIFEFDAIAAAAVKTGANPNFVFSQHGAILKQLDTATQNLTEQDLLSVLALISALNRQFMEVKQYPYLAPPVDEPWPLEILNFDALPIVGLALNFPYVSKSSPIVQTLSAVLAMMAYQDYFPTDTRKLGDSISFSEIASVLNDLTAPEGQNAFNNIDGLMGNDPETAAALANGGLPIGIAPGNTGETIGQYLRDLVNFGILQSSPGWCGEFGPGVDGTVSLIVNQGPSPLPTSEGNYDMTQMHLIPLVYNYYDELSSDARDHLINQLLARGRIHGPNEDDRFTSGPPPNDWTRAGYISPAGLHKDIGETENHIFMISTARYLTNQLLYQRNPQQEDYDNRRNSRNGGPTCMGLLLAQLQNCLRDDFSEYNAKSYQEETRWALLNLCTYAYDHEVRLAARIVLDHVSAHVAVSSNDLRRIVPFRRRNEGSNVAHDGDGFMTLGLADAFVGADPLVPYFAVQAGNIRVFQTNNTQTFPVNGQGTIVRPGPWWIRNGDGSITREAISGYRLPPLLYDLFVNDLHRRFFQRLHRTPQNDAEGARNCDNVEIYASSPSYLITAGGEPAQWALDPNFGPFHPGKEQQLGVAMPTTFMPTGQSAGYGTQNIAQNLIQFSHFSEVYDPPEVKNYGVAPDFMCGFKIHTPRWLFIQDAVDLDLNDGLFFVDRGSSFVFSPPGPDNYVPAATAGLIPGFYLAIYKDGDYALLEAFDTWLHPDVTFPAFKSEVSSKNPSLNLRSPGEYTTFFGTKISFVINPSGASVTGVTYSAENPTDSHGDAGNVTGPFLNGTILNSIAEAVTEIRNPFFGQGDAKILLDMRDELHPRRISETGEVEQAGFNNEVWVNFGWKGPTEGDFFHPFNSMTAAAEAVAPGGTIRVVTGWTNERAHFIGKKNYKVVIAGAGSARIGIQ